MFDEVYNLFYFNIIAYVYLRIHLILVFVNFCRDWLTNIPTVAR